MSPLTERPLVGVKWPMQEDMPTTHTWVMAGPHGVASRTAYDTREIAPGLPLFWADCSFHVPVPKDIKSNQAFMHDGCLFLEGVTCYAGVTWSGNPGLLNDLPEQLISRAIDGDDELVFAMLRGGYDGMARQSLEHIEQIREDRHPWGDW